jgi:BMFP domain-containing protein YqiC
MIDNRFIDELSQKLSGIMPPGARELREDMERNIRAVLQSSFQKLELVTREEFEVQSEVLANTRAKLNTLEEQVKQLEARLGDAQPGQAGGEGE